MRRIIGILFFLTACSRNGGALPDASPSIAIVDADFIAPADASVAPAAVARPDCAEPAKLTQLGTVKDVAKFSGELLVGQTHSYDPETLAPGALPTPPAPEKSARTPSRYTEIVNGVGLIAARETDGAVVENVTTHKKILQVDACSAGGFWSFSLSTTGRFLVCNSNRSGLTLWDLRAPQKARWKDEPSGEGITLAPNDAYAVAVPVLSWGSDEPTRDDITYFDLDARKIKSFAKAPDPENDVGNEGEDAHPYVVDFCGVGELFAVSGYKELTVYRGKDGARLAGAPALKGGYISFSESGKYLSQNRNGKTTLFRLDL